jgi:hypothetical protein
MRHTKIRKAFKTYIDTLKDAVKGYLRETGKFQKELYAELRTLFDDFMGVFK